MKYQDILHDNLNLSIIHQEVFDKEGGFQTDNWKQIDKTFTWSITRPNEPSKTFTRKCEYCSEDLNIEVKSLEGLEHFHKRWEIISRVSLIISSCLLL